MVQYLFTGKEHPVHKPPHGNSKSITPYKCILPSTMDRMKKLASEKGPVATSESIDKEIGGVIGQQSADSRLRNPLQVCNARQRLSLTH